MRYFNGEIINYQWIIQTEQKQAIKLCKAARAAMYTIIEIVLIKRLTKIRKEILKEKSQDV